MTKKKVDKASEAPTLDLLTLKQAAEYLGPGCTERWIRRHVYELRTIKTKRLGRKRLVSRSELDRIVTEGTNL